MPDRFLQIHFLTSYPASLLNRDDAGFAKRIPFGGASRTRISSQCLKRHWRTFDGENSLRDMGVSMSIRSRVTFERHVLTPLAEEFDHEIAVAVVEGLMATVLGESAKAKAAKKQDEGEAPVQIRTGQITILGRPEVDYLLELGRGVCREAKDAKAAAKLLKDLLGREGKKNLKELKHAAGLDAALFGRMVTSDILARGDAAVHVAHAFTVHEEATEPDYFSAVDDLLAEEEAMGSGHIGSTELTCGLFYGYVVIDIPLLVSNLEGCTRADWASADRSLAEDTVGRLVHLIAKVSPGAKLGSTAPYSYASLVLAEAGSAQPRTFANAFLKPVNERPDLLANAYVALGAHLKGFDLMYGQVPRRRVAGFGPVDEIEQTTGIERASTLDEISKWAASVARGQDA